MVSEETAARISLALFCEAKAATWTTGGTATIPGVGAVAVFRHTLVWHWVYSDVIRPRTGSASGWALTHRGAWLTAREAVLRGTS